MRKLVYGIGTVLVLLLAFSLWYHANLRPANSKDQTTVIVQVPQGSSVSAIAKDLEEQGIIRSAAAFSLYARFAGLQTAMKAGSYLLRPSMGIEEIAGVLTRGFSSEMIVTIPEGFTVAQIDKLMADKGMLKAGDIITCAKTCDFSGYTFLPKDVPANAPGGKVEGYLFPDTYFVLREGMTAHSFLKRLLDSFEKHFEKDLTADFSASKHSVQEIMAMASLIEEETRTDEERPVVSGILWKRFDAGMKLDVDAAVRYIVGKKTKPLTANDLQTDSPYNLRKVKGLPPTPITNPGLKSIKAALNPVDSPYWFYLHGTDGVIRYAKTNEEHNENRAKYLR